jgi:DNA-binding CsgD family transcriptional regulator
MVAHRALASVLDGDRRVWHLAAVADGPDEEVAAQLVAAAERASRQGSRAAASAAYERAARLSPDPQARGSRLALAASAAADAGQLPRAADLAMQVGCVPADPAAAAALAGAQMEVELEAGRPAEAVRYALDGATLLATTDHESALALVIQAVSLLWLSAGPIDPELEQRVVAVLPPPGQGLAEFLQAVRRVQDGETHAMISAPAWPARDRLMPGDVMAQLTFDIIRGDVQAVSRRAAGMAAECRDAGVVGLLAYALVYLANAQFAAGDFLDAMASAEEGLRIADDTGQASLTGLLATIAALLAAVTGDEEACRARAAQVRGVSTSSPTLALVGADTALAMFDLGRSRYQSALDRMETATYGPARHNPEVLYGYPLHVEAAVRAGRPDLAAGPLARFTAWADAIDQPWAAAVAARCAALTAGDAGAGALYERALAAHDGDGRMFEQARTRLMYGEWLRRNQRRADAREHLLAAAGAFSQMGARPWQDRAEAELRAVGAGAAALSTADPLARLTPQELQVVRLAASGASNKQIGSQLFLSPRTVGYHLYKAFPKLGVAGREELVRFAS